LPCHREHANVNGGICHNQSWLCRQPVLAMSATSLGYVGNAVSAVASASIFEAVVGVGRPHASYHGTMATTRALLLYHAKTVFPVRANGVLASCWYSSRSARI
jgi:hypothetical protein